MSCPDEAVAKGSSDAIEANIMVLVTRSWSSRYNLEMNYRQSLAKRRSEEMSEHLPWNVVWRHRKPVSCLLSSPLILQSSELWGADVMTQPLAVIRITGFQCCCNHEITGKVDNEVAPHLTCTHTPLLTPIPLLSLSLPSILHGFTQMMWRVREKGEPTFRVAG